MVIVGDILYNQGEQLQLNCLSEGGPILEYSWLFSGDIIPNADMNTLTIDNVNTTHAGDYSCNVTNDAGADSDTITVYSKSLVPRPSMIIKHVHSVLSGRTLYDLINFDLTSLYDKIYLQ